MAAGSGSGVGLGVGVEVGLGDAVASGMVVVAVARETGGEPGSLVHPATTSSRPTASSLTSGLPRARLKNYPRAVTVAASEADLPAGNPLADQAAGLRPRSCGTTGDGRR